MSRILVTGGKGHLGRKLTPRLLKAGHTVRIMSRSPNPGTASEVDWAQAALATGEGLDEALRGMDTIIHAASSAADPKEVDIEGTRRLLDAAGRAGVSHVYYISIVGIDRHPLSTFRYYQAKLAAERLIESSPTPWTILRATQFHYFVEMLIAGMSRFPVALLPVDFKAQTIDTGELADHMVASLAAGPSGRLPDVGGPQVMTLREMAGEWQRVRGFSRPVVRLPLPFTFARGYRMGQNTAPENPLGRITWTQWLEARHAAATRLRETGASA